MTSRRQKLGQRGEALARAELLRRGYTIREANWRCQAGEIDLVAAHQGWLVFVEVRTRRGNWLGTPEESVTPAKQAKLIEVAYHYLDEQALSDVNWRIDVVAVELSRGGKLTRLDVYENAVTG